VINPWSIKEKGDGGLGWVCVELSWGKEVKRIGDPWLL
jgi:hypothetical protein